jgi:pSer/pThr/pTyr-binding forkhead associated (FHA) protein
VPGPEPEDLEDTIIGAAPRAAAAPSSFDEDTIVKGRADTGRADNGVVPNEPASPVPAPRYHAIRIGTHDPIPLDVPTFIGRRPSTPRITGGRHPRLVRVPSLSREISSTHLEIRQEGSIVVVTDLGSTNGTMVTSPGAAPLRLRQGESVAVVVGSVVDIGDDVRIEILPIPEVTQ